jgi:hypothetical protein
MKPKMLVLFPIGLICLFPTLLSAQTELIYQNRGDRYEGIRPRPVSGYEIEMISFLADYKDSTNRFPEQIRVRFYLPEQDEVYVTVREQDYKTFYWLDRVKPAKNWQPRSHNEFTWFTEPVLKKLEQHLDVYALGVVIRIGYQNPSINERLAPAILYHSRPPDTVEAYLFTMKTNADARLSCSVWRGRDKTKLLTQIVRRIDGGRPFTVRWAAGEAEEGSYTLRCKGYFLDTNAAIHQTVDFYHRPTPK